MCAKCVCASEHVAICMCYHIKSAALGCARPPARGSKKEAVTAGFRRKKQYHLEVETTSLAIYLTVGFRRKKQYHLEVETTLWGLQMNYIEKTML